MRAPLFIALAVLFPAQALAVPINFSVEVPYCTPPGAEVMLRSNRLDAGTVRHDALTRVGPNRFEGSFDVAVPLASFAYRYSLGVCDAAGCPGIEKQLIYDGTGFDLADRTVAAGTTRVSDLAYVWRSALVHYDAQGAVSGLRTNDEKVAFCAPYLSLSTVEGAITIGYDSFDAGQVSLELGTTPALGETLANTGDYRNFFQLADLVPGTRYYYRLREAGELRHEGSFLAPVAPGTPFRFGFLGDTQYYGEQQRSDTQAVVDALLAFDPHLVLSPGDMVASERGPTGWLPPEMGRFSVFFGLVAPLVARAPFLAAMGNHEEDAGYYWSVFDFPKPDAPRIDHYHFKYGNVLFIALYTGVTEGYDQNGILDSQTFWLRDLLEQSAADASIRWRVVVLHRGPFSQGASHPTDGQSFYDNSGSNRPSWGSIWESNGVDLVLAGHNHNLTVAENAGVRYVTSCGGAPVHDLREPYLPTTIYAERTCSADLFSVGEKTISFSAERPDGSPIDAASFALCKVGTDCDELTSNCPEAVTWSCERRACRATCVAADGLALSPMNVELVARMGDPAPAPATIAVSSAGTQQLGVRLAGCGEGLSCNLSANDTPATVSITLDASALARAPGTYTSSASLARTRPVAGASIAIPVTIRIQPPPLVANRAPGVPRPESPIDGVAVEATGVRLSFGNAVDPDGDPLRYEVLLFRAGAELAELDIDGVLELATSSFASVDRALLPGEAYEWQVRAIDGRDLAGEYSARARFVVSKGAEGCGCKSSSIGRGGISGVLGSALVIAMLVRAMARRRARQKRASRPES